MDGLHEIGGGCHCGNITYRFFSPVPEMELAIRSCDCSFCRKQGACYTAHPQGALKVVVRESEQVTRYRFGSESADVFLCSRCGVFPFIVGRIDDQLYAALNANSIDGLQIERAAVKTLSNLDKQSTEERLERWKKLWIPQVEISYLNRPVNPAIL